MPGKLDMAGDDGRGDKPEKHMHADEVSKRLKKVNKNVDK
jgi:hypothetical protein